MVGITCIYGWYYVHLWSVLCPGTFIVGIMNIYGRYYAHLWSVLRTFIVGIAIMVGIAFLDDIMYRYGWCYIYGWNDIMVGIRLTDLAGITFMAKHTLNVGSQGYTKHESKYH